MTKCICGTEIAPDNVHDHQECGTAMLTDLLACPFCGKDAHEYTGYRKDQVGCINPQCRMYRIAFDKSEWQSRL